MNRIVKNVSTGSSVGMDELGRYITPGQRDFIVRQLSGEVEQRSAMLVADARAAAAAILRDAEVAAGAIRAEAHAEGKSAGYSEGHAAAEAECLHLIGLLRRAAEEAEAVRVALLGDVERQTVELALAAAEKVVGEAARSHADLTVSVVRAGIRGAGGRVLRVRVHPDAAEPVQAAVLHIARDAEVIADTAIDIGGCLIDIDGGSIDLSLDAQLSSIRRLLTDE